MAQKNVSKKLELSNFFNSSYVKQCFYNIGESGALFVNANDAASKHNSAGFNERLQILNGDDLPPKQLWNLKLSTSNEK